MVAGCLVGSGRVTLEFFGIQEAEDVEPVGGQDDNGLHGGFAEEGCWVDAVGGADLEPAAV